MTFKRTLLAAAVTGAVLATGTAHATNGYFKHGYGVKSMGMAGGGVAFANNSAMIIATNPAGLAEVDNQFNAELSWFRPERGYDQTSGQALQQGMNGFEPAPFTLPAASADSDSENFYVPGLGAAYSLTENDTIGIAIYGNGGMNSDYKADADGLVFAPGMGAYAEGPAGVNLEQMFIAPTYARSFMEGKLSLGVTPMIVRQKFKANGLGNFAGFSTNGDDGLTGNGHDVSWGYGGKIGITYKPMDMLTLGASYQSKMEMDEFDDYDGLFAEGGDFDIPSTWTVGLAADVTDAVTVTFDYQRINYTDVKAIANPSVEFLNECFGARLMGGDSPKCLGGANGAGFGWDDINVYKLGVQWQATPQLQLRAGWNRGDNPIDSADVLFNTIAPGVVENHYTAGFSYAFDGGQHEVHGAFMYAPEEKVTGANDYNPGSDLTIRMKQYEATVGYTYKF
ncbi:outer membrane protein transport protein [Guyparkeria hydrothermalis]|uniref:OmpP1/FadL family transporter n=1 Tax=Guyparkeria hydrothermalis TaxID=923 RepID=UPI00201FE6F5|nr:outer membrane protein transport protein [Guyparkeria hydrothermalis]MCL7751305.1 outer membrane protein transport protein [Guyparkeria hydrothermalis]